MRLSDISHGGVRSFKRNPGRKNPTRQKAVHRSNAKFFPIFRASRIMSDKRTLLDMRARRQARRIAANFNDKAPSRLAAQTRPRLRFRACSEADSSDSFELDAAVTAPPPRGRNSGRSSARAFAECEGNSAAAALDPVRSGRPRRSQSGGLSRRRQPSRLSTRFCVPAPMFRAPAETPPMFRAPAKTAATPVANLISPAPCVSASH